GHCRIHKDHIRLAKIALVMAPQYKTDGEVMQGRQRGGERLGPLQVSDGDVCPLVCQIARKANATAKGAESHDGDVRLVPGRRQRQCVAMIPWSRPGLLLQRVRDVLHVCQSPSGAGGCISARLLSASSRRTVWATAATSCTRTNTAPCS